MSVINYTNVPVVVAGQTGTASSASISYQAGLKESRILAANQNNNFRLSAPLQTTVSINLAVCNKSGYNVADLLFNQLTGNTGATILIGDKAFAACYLTKASVAINPFALISASAEFVCTDMPTGATFNQSGTNNTSLSGYLAHGHNVEVVGSALLSDQNYTQLSYSVNCQRTPKLTVGNTNPSFMFLDAVEKECSIQASNIGNLIKYDSYGVAISISPKNDLGANIFSIPLSLSSNARILTQNLNVQADDILVGDLSLKEIIL